MNDQILYNIGLLMSQGCMYSDALIYAVNFYMEHEQEMTNVTIH